MDKKEIRSGSDGINGASRSGSDGINEEARSGSADINGAARYGSSGRGGEDKKKIIEKIVVVLVLGYGLHYLGYFIRTRYYDLLGSMALDEGPAHALLYLGHLVFFAIMIIYAWAVPQDRHYFFSFLKGSAADKLKYGALGILSGAFLMGSCVFAASMHGDIEIKGSSGGNLAVLLFALVCVFVQSSVEEIEGRGFVFGKMHSEGVPLIPAIIASAMFFSFLHINNPGFGLIPFTNVFLFGVLSALSCYYFNNLWFAMMTHMTWNYMQDFLFGLPDSGHPAAISFMNTIVHSSGFFYDENFGIEGSCMATVMQLLGCLLIILIGRVCIKKREPLSEES